MGHTGGLIDPRPWPGRCQAGYSNTERGHLIKETLSNHSDDFILSHFTAIKRNCPEIVKKKSPILCHIFAATFIILLIDRVSHYKCGGPLRIYLLQCS